MRSMRSFFNRHQWMQVRLVMRIKLLILSVCIMPFIYKTLPQILISMNYSLVITKIGLQKPAQITDNTEFIGIFFCIQGFMWGTSPSYPSALCSINIKYEAHTAVTALVSSMFTVHCISLRQWCFVPTPSSTVVHLLVAWIYMLIVSSLLWPCILQFAHWFCFKTLFCSKNIEWLTLRR